MVYDSYQKRLGTTESTQKLEIDLSYGYEVFSKNAAKCTMPAHWAHFRTLSLIAL